MEYKLNLTDKHKNLLKYALILLRNKNDEKIFELKSTRYFEWFDESISVDTLALETIKEDLQYILNQLG